MLQPRFAHDRPGIALVTAVLVLLVVASVAATAAVLSSNVWLINEYDEQQGVLEAVADAGLEEARARINGTRGLYPDSGYVALESDAVVEDAFGEAIPGVRRWVYAGPSGATTGQYGVFGSIVSIAESGSGARVVRRMDVSQESFAKFAYFTDREPWNIAFGGGDQLFGPVHSNDDLRIYSSGATFHGAVSTAGTVRGAEYGTFHQGYTEHAAVIPMPEMADLEKLRDYAADANLVFTGSSAGADDQATLRLEFLALDLNGDGDTTDGNEGFLRVYRADTFSDIPWVTADVPSDYYSSGLRNSENCGHYHGSTFVSARDHSGSSGHNWVSSLVNHGRCYLGGSDSIFGGFTATDAHGRWLSWPGGVSAPVSATGRADAGYLFPLSRELNPDFKGVIFVEGKVAVSGVVRGQITLAATDNIIIADDITYATDPGSPERVCTASSQSKYDILGLFSGGDVIVANNTVNAPTKPNPNAMGIAKNYFSFDDTTDEFVHGTVLTLNTFTVHRYDQGARKKEPCGTTNWGRGCLFLTGGIVQQTRGPVGTSAGTGYLKRYSYDHCAGVRPPPYFPTTGHFRRGRYVEVDPTGFDIDEYFDLLAPGA